MTSDAFKAWFQSATKSNARGFGEGGSRYPSLLLSYKLSGPCHQNWGL